MNKKLMIWIIMMFLLVFNVNALLLNNDVIEYWDFEDDLGEKGKFNITSVGEDIVPGIIGNGYKSITSTADLFTFDLKDSDLGDYWSVNCWYNLTTSTNMALFLSEGPPFNEDGLQWWNIPNLRFYSAWGQIDVTQTATSATAQPLKIWTMITGIRNSTNRGKLYKDGSFLSQSASNPVAWASNGNNFRTRMGADTSRTLNGVIDECSVFNYSLTPSQINELWNGGLGLSYPFGPGVNDTLNISSSQPINGSLLNTLPIVFNLTANATSNFDCDFNLDGGLNQSTSFSNGINIAVNFTLSLLVEGNHNYSINCTDNTTSESTTVNNFTFDFQPPTLITNFINNTMLLGNNITGQFNLSDNLLLHSLNVTIDKSTIFNISHIHSSSFVYNLTYNVTENNLTIGKHNLTLRFADGHTADYLLDPEAYNPTNGFFNDYIKFRFEEPYEKGFVKMKEKDGGILDSYKTERHYDRYTITYRPWNKRSTYTFIVESDKKLSLYKSPNSEYGGYWLVIGNENWYDFVVKDQESIVNIIMIDDYMAEVTISNLDPSKEIEFESIGDLNIVQVEYDFYRINMTNGLNDVILGGIDFNVNLTVDFGTLDFDITGLVPQSILEFDKTNYSISATSFTTSQAFFRKFFNGSFASSLINGTINHTWFFNMSNLTGGFIKGDDSNQTKIDIIVAPCNSTFNDTILNITYSDEVSLDSINITNAYNIKITDGVKFYNQTGVFVINNVTYDGFCSNVGSGVSNYNFNSWGTYTLSKADYITRIITIDESIPQLMSINPHQNLDLFMIKLNESTTVVFSWLTTSWQPISGIMRVFKCEVDGSRSLTESIPVIGGSTSANSPSLALLTQAYSYDIIIDDVIFVDNADFSACHVETQTARQFFVNLGSVDVSGFLGLQQIPCTFTKISNNSARMIWGSNPERDGYVSGCIKVQRKSITGFVEILDNCSSQLEGFDRTLVLPITSANTFVVSGRLEQDNETKICGNDLVFSPVLTAGGFFGPTGIFAVFLLLSALGLAFITDGEKALIAVSVGLVASYFLSILAFGWVATISLILISVIIIYIARRTRHQ